MRTIAFALVAALAAAPLGAVAPLKNDFNARLKRLPELQQRAVMRRAVLDDRQYCRHIGKVAYQGPYKNLEMWTVRCDRDVNYGAFIGLDGTVQVRPCKDMASLKLPACRLPK